MRREVCIVAKELADERGGVPSQYMSEAWDIVKDSHNYQPKRRSELKEEKRMGFLGVAAKAAGTWIAKKAVETGREKRRNATRKIRSGATNAKSDLNFMKAPRDNPSDVMGGIAKMFTKSPDKIQLPDSVRSYAKDTFRLK